MNFEWIGGFLRAKIFNKSWDISNCNKTTAETVFRETGKVGKGVDYVI